MAFQFRGRYRDIKDRSRTSISKFEDQSNHDIPNDEQKKDIPETHGSYAALILHPNWKSRRKEILERDQYRCVVCKDTRDLQVHHRQYHFVAITNQFKAPWDYPDHLLLTLCIKCHAQGHSKFKVPIIKI